MALKCLYTFWGNFKEIILFFTKIGRNTYRATAKDRCEINILKHKTI